MKHLAGIVLAGGQSQRMQYQNKGLVHFKEKTMISYAIKRLQALVDYLVISANQNLSDYEQYNIPVIPDLKHSHLQGPLLGIYSAALTLASDCEAVIINPCDTPLLSQEVIIKLYQTWQSNTADIVVAQTQNMLHPSIFVVSYHQLLTLKQYQPDQNNFSLRRWIKSLKHHIVTFNDEILFCNINDFLTLHQVEQQTRTASC